MFLYFLICTFLCFTVPAYSSFIFIRSTKGWKSLSGVKILVNYLRMNKKVLEDRKACRIALVCFPRVFRQYFLPDSTILEGSDFLENLINHVTQTSALIPCTETRGE